MDRLIMMLCLVEAQIRLRFQVYTDTYLPAEIVVYRDTGD